MRFMQAVMYLTTLTPRGGDVFSGLKSPVMSDAVKQVGVRARVCVCVGVGWGGV